MPTPLRRVDIYSIAAADMPVLSE